MSDLNVFSAPCSSWGHYPRVVRCGDVMKCHSTGKTSCELVKDMNPAFGFTIPRAKDQ